MKALKIEPGKAPERIDVANELASLQSLVGGYIEGFTRMNAARSA